VSMAIILQLIACTPESSKLPETNSKEHSKARTDMPRVKPKIDPFKENGLEGLQANLQQFCQQLTSKGEAQSISVHFLDLNSDSSFTINGEVKYVPASLMKLGIMMALYKLDENVGGVLNTPLKHNYRYQDNSDSSLQENHRFKYKENESLTIKELITIMMQFSDNNATLNLLYFLDQRAPGFLQEVEAELKAGIPEDKDMMDDLVKVDHFSQILIALYKENFLDILHTHQALDLLRQSKYDLGIRKGIPLSIPIAHKYGVRFNTNDDKPLTPVQLHELGIIYHPTRPFLLSIMTKGQNIESLREVLQKIADKTYTHINAYEGGS